MIVCVPFSYWRTDSLEAVVGYAKAPLLVILLMAGVHNGRSMLRGVLDALFYAGIVNIMAGLAFGLRDERFSFGFGTMGNSNDWAAHMVFMLPFLAMPLFLKDRPKLMKVASVPGCLAALYFILSTGSRGAAVALFVAALSLFLMVRWKGRLAFALAVLLSLPIVAPMVPDDPLDRIQSFVAGARDEQAEAILSREGRLYYLQESIRLTFEHPIVGVGPQQFITAMGREHRRWKAAHNSYTQISSEMGLPGALLFAIALGQGLLLTLRARNAKGSPGSGSVSTEATFIFAASAGLLTAAAFLSLSYLQYFPMIAGLGILLNFEVQRLSPATDALRGSAPGGSRPAAGTR